MPDTLRRNPPPARAGRRLSGALKLAVLLLPLCFGRARAEARPEIEMPETETAAIAAPKPDSAQATPATVQSPAAEAPKPDSGQATPATVQAPAAAPADTAKGTEAPAVAVPLMVPPPGPTVESAQSAPDPDDITIEVDPGQSRNKDKSLPLAMLLSAALPGTGELYLHENKSAKTFLLAEAGFWASLYAAVLVRESYLSSARNYASEFAGIDASGKSAAFLEIMGNYRSYLEKQHRQDSYELAQQLSGKRDGNYDIPAVEENYWDFGSSVNPENTRNWRTFQSTLRYYRSSKVAISFAIGALALNRLASLAHTLRTYKRTSSRGMGVEFIPELGPDYTGGRLSLGF